VADENNKELEKLQNTLNKAKVLSAVSGIHNLTPPQQRESSDEGKVAIIEALRVSPRLQEMFLEVQGLEYSDKKKEVVRVSRPIMNIDGAFRLVKICKRIAEEAEWSYYDDDEIKGRIMAYYSENYPHFTFWHVEYGLDPADFNYVSTVLMSFIDSAFHKAKSAKFVNAISRMYNEDFLGRVMNQGGQAKEKQPGFLAKMNPFKQN
jgi:hypothetical protein